jgi:hypothetical protein
MLLYWRGVGKLTGYSKIRSHQITETKKAYSKYMKRYWGVYSPAMYLTQILQERIEKIQIIIGMNISEL